MQKLITAGQIHDLKTVTHIPGASEWLRGEKVTSPSIRYTRSPFTNRCIQIKANALASVPWGIFDTQNTDESDAPARLRVTNPLMLLLTEVNSEMNGVDLMRYTCADLDVYGAAYWLKLDKNFIQRINPGSIKPKIKNGELLGFERTAPEVVQYEREDIVYFHEYNPLSDFEGLSLVNIAKEAIDIEYFADVYTKAFFDNNAIPNFLLTTEQTMNEPDFERTQRWWDRLFRGAKKQHKTGILDKGLTPHTLGYPLKDLALTEVRAEARRSIAAVLGVPPVLVGIWEAANYATMEASRQSLYEETIIPRCEYMAGVINAELIAPYGTNYKFDWLFDEIPIMQEDENAKAASISMLVRDGVITPQAGAAELGYQPEDAGIGPIQTRILDQEADIVPGGSGDSMTSDLRKWEKKSLNALKRKGGAAVDFESDHIPAGVSEYITGVLVNCKTADDIGILFNKFLEV